MWCAGFGSDAATGWPGTDWVEDLVLRQAGPEVYDQWVTHEIPFTDPAIADAFDAVGEILLNPDYVNAGFGDVKSINSTPFGDAARALGDGSCHLHHQASFYDGFIQDPDNGNATVGPDADIWAFITPGVEAGAPAVTGGGEIVAAFSNDADTVKVQEFLSSPEWANSRVSLGGVISANNGLDPANASSPILQEAIKHPAGPEHHVPLRRVRPHAGRRGSRFVLDGHGRLDQRQVDRRGARHHRRLMAVGVAASS